MAAPPLGLPNPPLATAGAAAASATGAASEPVTPREGAKRQASQKTGHTPEPKSNRVEELS
eukprot:3899653-Amphidinium_carterae.1